MNKLPKISKAAKRIIEASFAEIVPSIDTSPEQVVETITRARMIVREAIAHLEKNEEEKPYISNRKLSKKLRLEAEQEKNPSVAKLLNAMAQSIACLLKGDGSWLGQDSTAFLPLEIIKTPCHPEEEI